MHEMSLCEGVIEILEQEARRQDFQRVKAVWLEIGALSHVEPDAMLFCFDAVSRGTIADGAKLEILRPPGQGWCLRCSQTIALSQRYDPCPQCGGHQIQITGGDDLRVKELEVE